MSFDQETNTLSIEKVNIEIKDIGTHAIGIELKDTLGAKTYYKFNVVIQQIKFIVMSVRNVTNETSKEQNQTDKV